MRLIDAGKLLEYIKDLPTWWADAGGVYGKSMKYPSGMFDCEDVVGSIEDAPTVDAVVVTRCKDCKYLRVWNQKDLYAFCPKTNFVFLPFQADTRTHFCSYGEPKET